jgi:hypothetical protein
VIHESNAFNPEEWIEWDLNGNLLNRTVIPKRIADGRAYTSDGRLYVRFRVARSQRPELRVLDRATGDWLRVAANVPEAAEEEGAFLLGADGRELVYRVGYGNVRLHRVKPGDQ